MHFDLINQMKILFIITILFTISVFDNENIKLKFLLSAFFVLLISNNDLVNKISYIKDYKFRIYGYQDRYLDERIRAFYIYKGINNLFSVKDVKKYTYFQYLNANYGLNYNEKYINELENNLHEVDKNYLYKEYLKDGGCEFLYSDADKADFNLILNKEYILNCKYPKNHNYKAE